MHNQNYYLVKHDYTKKQNKELVNTERKYSDDVLKEKRHRHGAYYFTSDEKYVEEWKDDKSNGTIILYFAKGNKYDGEYKDD